jgi:ABC-type spermidine/putrescine transport system permease subunit I
MKMLGKTALTRPRRHLRFGWFVSLVPVLALLLVFFVIPLADLLGLSFVQHQPGPRLARGEFTLVNYREIFGDPFYVGMIFNSLQLGFWTVLATLFISYPVAFYLTRARSWERTLISVACLLPIFINVIVGILGWYILLLPFGVFQQVLAWVGLVDGPIQWLRNFWAIVAVLTYEHLPFAVLILASTLQNIPEDKINAARILGASPFQILRTLVLPLTMPGIIASAILVFALSVSSYLVPILIAGPRTQLLPISIFSFASELLNWPMASAMALVLLIIVGALTYGVSVIADRLTKRGQWEMV